MGMMIATRVENGHDDSIEVVANGAVAALPIIAANHVRHFICGWKTEDSDAQQDGQGHGSEVCSGLKKINVVQPTS